MQTLIQQLHCVKGIDPVADYNNGTVYSDIVSMKNHESVMFIVYKGVATGGTATGTFTVEASDDFSGSTVAAVPFFYSSSTTGDTFSALAKATTTGFAAAAGSSQLHKIEVRYGDVASTGYTNVRLKLAETVNDPVVGCVLVVLGNPRNLKDPAATAIA